MSRGYPSRKRVRKAFERGVKTARTGRGFNPYKNPILKDLYERGKSRTPKLADTTGQRSALAQPPRPAPRAQSRSGNQQAPRSGSLPQSQSMRNNPFDPPRRMGQRRP